MISKEKDYDQKIRKTDVDKVANLWLEANLTAHDFISEKYWKDHFNMVKEQLLQAEVYIYEDCQNISGFIGITDEYVEGFLFLKNEITRNR